MSTKLLAIAGLAAAMSAQSQRPAFEVASIKPNKSGGGMSSVRITPGQVFMENVSLRKCIALAYNVSENQDSAVAGPDWIRSEVYDIIAKFPPETPLEQVRPEQVRMMLQELLADRFKLRLHRESKEVPVYALMVGKTGAKLQESASGTPSGFSMGSGHIEGRAASMAALADRLSNASFQLGRPVLDRTGLKGAYDFTLDWTPDGAQEADATGPSLFTAVQEKLGLRLEAQRGLAEVLVIDSMARKPTEN
jgi:uncharacterized protein (TIGR03435 family)